MLDDPAVSARSFQGNAKANGGSLKERAAKKRECAYGPRVFWLGSGSLIESGHTMKLVNIGFGNLVSGERLLAVVSPDSAPIKRLVQESRERGMLIDATYGRKTAAILIMDSDHVILSALAPEKLAPRFGIEEEEEHL